MRIAHVTDCYLPRTGGIELQVRDLAHRQRAAGHTAIVLTRTDADVAAPGADEHFVRRLAFREIRAALAEVDVAHIHTSLVSPFAWAGAAAATDLGLPAVVTLHSVPRPAVLLDLAASAARWREWNVRWTAVSRIAAEPLRELLGSREVSVLHNGVAAEEWEVPEIRSPGKTLTIVSTMRFAPRKRPRPFVRVLERVRARLPPEVGLRVVLVGEGEQRASVQRMLARRGMDSWVETPGLLSRSGIRDVYRDADLYVAPGRLESFGIAALEARCAGLPVVAMACSGVSEFVRQGREGFLVEDDADLERTLLRLLAAPLELAAMRHHNAMTRPVMTWERTVESALAVYRDAARVARPTRHPADRARPGNRVGPNRSRSRREAGTRKAGTR